MSGPGERASILCDRESRRCLLMRKATERTRKEWTWDLLTPRGPRPRHAHIRLMCGNRETWKGPRG